MRLFESFLTPNVAVIAHKKRRVLTLFFIIA